MTQRALIFANGDVNDGPMVQRAIAGWQDTLRIAADGGARTAAALDVPVTIVIGDMDSLSSDELADLEPRAEILRYPPEKNETDLELALLYAVAHGATWIRIVGAVGDRLDQTLSNVYLMALPALAKVSVRMVAGKQETWLMGAGQHTIEGQAGDTLSLIPLNGTVRGVQTDGLYYPLRDEDLIFGPARGVSNVMNGAKAGVTVREGVLLVVHTLGRA
ncbi:thiamine pyrophosphokinase [Anaerolineae bacterium]|nr:thiamine pyrophosphokinase [Anaerolineae bacterium]